LASITVFYLPNTDKEKGRREEGKKGRKQLLQ